MIQEKTQIVEYWIIHIYYDRHNFIKKIRPGSDTAYQIESELKEYEKKMSTDRIEIYQKNIGQELRKITTILIAYKYRLEYSIKKNIDKHTR